MNTGPDFRGLVTMLVKIKYTDVHEPELVTGNGSSVEDS